MASKTWPGAVTATQGELLQLLSPHTANAHIHRISLHGQNCLKIALTKPPIETLFSVGYLKIRKA